MVIPLSSSSQSNSPLPIAGSSSTTTTKTAFFDAATGQLYQREVMTSALGGSHIIVTPLTAVVQTSQPQQQQQQQQVQVQVQQQTAQQQQLSMLQLQKHHQLQQAQILQQQQVRVQLQTQQQQQMQQQVQQQMPQQRSAAVDAVQTQQFVASRRTTGASGIVTSSGNQQQQSQQSQQHQQDSEHFSNNADILLPRSNAFTNSIHQHVHGHHHHSRSNKARVEGVLVKVQFRVRYFIYDAPLALEVRVGDHVVVEGDRGIDIGMVTEVGVSEPLYTVDTTSRSSNSDSNVGPGGNASHQNTAHVPKVLRLASELEVGELYSTRNRIAMQVLSLLQDLQKRMLALGARDSEVVECDTRIDVMRFIDCEMQYDLEKMTVFFASDVYVPFVNLARFLHRRYRCRVWIHDVRRATPGVPPTPGVTGLPYPNQSLATLSSAAAAMPPTATSSTNGSNQTRSHMTVSSSSSPTQQQQTQQQQPQQMFLQFGQRESPIAPSHQAHQFAVSTTVSNNNNNSINRFVS